MESGDSIEQRLAGFDDDLAWPKTRVKAVLSNGDQMETIDKCAQWNCAVRDP